MRAWHGLIAICLAGECAAEAPAVVAPAPPYTVTRIALPGPLAGVLVSVNLADPSVSLKVALTDSHDPDGDGPCVGQLDTTSHAARKAGFTITMNASFFAAPASRDVLGKKVRYFVGNCSTPVGWHVAAGKLITKPANDKLRATLVIDAAGRASIVENLREMPPGTRYAVSGNDVLLRDGKITHTEADATRHPRSAAGLSRDGSSLFLLVIDGRQAAADGSGVQHSRGANLFELGEILKRHGAANAINLDGGGSSTLVLKDPHTGVYTVANRPSDASALNLPLLMERPVADVIGITISARAHKKE